MAVGLSIYSRDLTWDTKGSSGLGTATDYGTGTYTYQISLDSYFCDKPYIDGWTWTGTTWDTTPNNKLDPIGNVEDGNDDSAIDSVKGKSEDKNSNGQLDGDLVVLNQYNRNLSPFDIDKDNNDPNQTLVELPAASNPQNINSDYEYSKAQVLKHTITHEIGHAVGMTENPDVNCVMYDY